MNNTPNYIAHRKAYSNEVFLFGVNLRHFSLQRKRDIDLKIFYERKER